MNLAEQNMRIHYIHMPTGPPPRPPAVNVPPPAAYVIETHPSHPVYAAAPLPPESSPPRPKFVSHEPELSRSPALVTCPACQSQVTTQVTYSAGTYAWIMCFVFILFGLWLGCCLIPFFASHFKDAYHVCPQCQRVLHIQKKTCC